MRLLVFVLLAASSLTACAPKICDPRPLPEKHKEIARFLPASAVVCGLLEDQKSLLVNFPDRDVTKLTTESMVKLAADNWSLGSSDAKGGYILATKGGMMLHLGISDQKNGGPYLGHVTGIMTLSGSKR